MNQLIRITEVSPRDGLQNEGGAIPSSAKIALVEKLLATGVDEIEVSSFVSARWVPQLGDAASVFAGIIPAIARRQHAAVLPVPMLSALVPNERGWEEARAVNESAGGKIIGKVSVFTAASETFSKRNTNATIGETIERFRPVIPAAHQAGVLVRGYISCAVACPFEGPIAPRSVIDVARRLVEIGVDEIDLGDTIGAGTPRTIEALLKQYADQFPITSPDIASPAFTLHLHDTFGQASACAATALRCGVRSFDASAAGLGGCPYASTPGHRAPGNISTELLVRTIHESGFETSINLERLHDATTFAAKIVNEARAAAS